MRRKSFLAALLIALIVFGAPAMVLGAGSDATINGTVLGPSGPIAGATVQVDYLAKGGLPKRTAVFTTAADGTWSYTGKWGNNRLTYSAGGYETFTEVFATAAREVYTHSVELTSVAPPTGSIEGRITTGTGAGLSGYVYFFKQNTDGTWPSGYLWQVACEPDGTYSSGPLPLGSYKVRLFNVHRGPQWWKYATTMELATPIDLTVDGQVVTGIDAQYPPPL